MEDSFQEVIEEVTVKVQTYNKFSYSQRASFGDDMHMKLTKLRLLSQKGSPELRKYFTKLTKKYSDKKLPNSECVYLLSTSIETIYEEKRKQFPNKSLIKKVLGF